VFYYSKFTRLVEQLTPQCRPMSRYGPSVRKVGATCGQAQIVGK